MEERSLGWGGGSQDPVQPLDVRSNRMSELDAVMTSEKQAYRCALRTVL